MRIEPGMLIKTNYNGPYRIKHALRDCTCPLFLDVINMDDPPARKPHIRLTCTRPDGTGKFLLNGWDEEKLQSLEKTWCGEKSNLDYDKIVVLKQDQPIQLSFF